MHARIILLPLWTRAVLCDPTGPGTIQIDTMPQLPRILTHLWLALRTGGGTGTGEKTHHSNEAETPATMPNQTENLGLTVCGIFDEGSGVTDRSYGEGMSGRT